MKKILNTIVSVTALGLMITSTLAGNREIAVDILQKGIVDGDRSIIQQHVSQDVIPHNPNAAPGRKGVLGYVDYLKTLEKPVTSRMVRVLSEGNLVVTQREVNFFGPKVIFDLLRFEDGKLAEHWDVIQPKVDKTASGRTMTNGTTQITDRTKTALNKTLVTDFVTDVLMKGKMEKLDTYLAPKYMQHNPFVPDGLAGLKSFIAHIAKQNITFYYSKIHNVVAEGNFVFVQSEGVFDSKPTAFNDLWRVKDGKIVEHWDAVQEVPKNFAHDNGMF